MCKLPLEFMSTFTWRNRVMARNQKRHLHAQQQLGQFPNLYIFNQDLNILSELMKYESATWRYLVRPFSTGNREQQCL